MSDDIWPHFKVWLTEERGLKRRSAINYASTVRRILAAVEPLTVDGLQSWIAEQPEHNRGAYRGAWRAYVAYLALCWPEVGVPTLPARQRSSEAIPAPVVAAMSAALERGVRIEDLATARQGIDPGRLERIKRAVPGLSSGELAACTSGDTVVLIAAADAEIIQRWSGSGEGDLLLPRAPGDHRGIPLGRIRRLVREYRKNK